MQKKYTLITFILTTIFPFVGLFAQSNGSITKGPATTIVADLLPNCPSNHITPLGKITSTDGKIWHVPAETNFLTGPKCSDLYNTCNGISPANLASAILSNIPVVEIDPNGEVITGFLFSDNYFELFVNGVLVGIDPIPFTPFNSCVVKFRVKRPYTLAVKLVDWEENLGLGSEINGGKLFHPGDGGFIAEFSDGTVTDSSWRAQTFYIAPIEDLNSVLELPNGTHSSATATISPTCDADCYGIHYDIPANWMSPNFDVSNWPAASLYIAAQVTNQAAFKNFEMTAWAKARFIWTSNLILDNLVLARKTVGLTNTSTLKKLQSIRVRNPFSDYISLFAEQSISNLSLSLFDLTGREVVRWEDISVFVEQDMKLILPKNLPEGFYFLHLQHNQINQSVKLIHCSF